MKASILDLRRRMSEILRALDRGESVTILYRGKERGVLHPSGGRGEHVQSVEEHAAFGMWRERQDMEDVEKTVRDLRRGRSHAV